MKEEALFAKLTIPCHWSKDTIRKIVNQNKVALSRVVEVYGVLADGGPVGHGRSEETVVAVSKIDAIKFREYLKKNELNFTYLLNAPFKNIKNKENNLKKYFDWIFNELKPDSLIISSLELMRYVRRINKKIPIHISTIAGIKTTKDISRFLSISPSRIIPHHDVGKNFGELKNIINLGKKRNFSVELMVTESCLFKCPNREEHYKHLTKENSDNSFHSTCNKRKIDYPREYLLAGGIIRPEDICFYEDMGVKFFKITGRSQNSRWLPAVVRAYQKRNYKGNLIRLLDVDPLMGAHRKIYLDNNSLEGFLENFPQGDDNMAQKYCERWIQELKQKEYFKILEK